MNKRFFTLMAAALLAGAPFASEAFAATGSTSTYAVSTTKLANNLKFIVKSGTSYFKVGTPASGKVQVEATASGTTTDAARFEIRNYSSTTKTFELYVGGNKVTTAAGDALFYASTTAGAVDDLSFTSINVAVVGGTGAPLLTGTAEGISYQLADGDLNANLSGKGFSFKFPNAVSQPDDNLFANQLIAVDADAVYGEWASAPNTTTTTTIKEVYFVVADDAGKKLLASGGVTDANLKAATFVVVNPNKNFGITSLTAANGEGFDFTTIKGDKLTASNDIANGKIAYANGVFTVTEADQLNAADEYQIQVSPYYVSGTNENASASGLYVGAYSLTAGGLKTYITTKGNKNDMSWASTTGNTWATAADVLKADGVAMYNLMFVGEKPANPAAAVNSVYGNYLLSISDGTTYDKAYAAPADVDVKSAAAQWYVSDVAAKGSITLKNLESADGVTLKLYKTSQAGVYELNNASAVMPGMNGAEKIKLIPSSGIDAFLTLSDDQLKQGAEIVFHGDEIVNVDDIYMGVSRGVAYATKEARYSKSWIFAKAASVKQKLDYVYLKGGEITPASVDTLAVQSYYLTTDGTTTGATANGLTYGGGSYALVAAPASGWTQYVFKKDFDGSLQMISLATTPTNYTQAVSATSEYVYVNTTTSDFAQDDLGGATTFNAVTVEFYSLGESLPAVPGYVTLESEEGAVSIRENRVGILEGIIAADALTLKLDTADTDADMPTFYLSKGISKEETETKADETASLRNFMYYPADSALYWDDDEAAFVEDYNYILEGTYYTSKDKKAVFSPVALVAEDTLANAAGKAITGNAVKNFKFYITEAYDEAYVISPAAAKDAYLYNLNGKLGFTTDATKALVVTVGEGDPTANEAIEAESNVQVIGGQGVVTVQGAAGKVVTVANILGQTIANQVAASDNVTIAVPAGIVVVAVDGEATKVIVK